MTGVIRNGLASVIGLIATLVRVVCSVIGALIVVHAAFVLFEANPHNVLVQFTAGIRDSFGWFTKNLFQPSDKKIAEAINDALAGFIWVFLGSLVAKFIARLAPASSGKKEKSSRKRDDTSRSTPVQKSRPAERPKEEAPKQEPAPLPRSEPAPEAEPEEEASAKHQARDTARDDERAGDKAQA